MLNASLLATLALLHSFWVWDLTVMPPGFRQPSFEQVRSVPLAGSKNRLNLWVETNLGEHTPSEATLAKVMQVLDERIVNRELKEFGPQPTPPSGNRDIELLIAAIPPYEKHGKKFGFDGFFNVFDQLTEAEALKHDQHSNERNVIYVNALQDVGSDYMLGVIAHELNHLITYARTDGEKNDNESWLNEMLGESAMQLTGFYTDTRHVEAYRRHPEWPLAVDGYGISYGGLSMLAEHLMIRYDSTLMGAVAAASGSAFEKLERVYGTKWSEIFVNYARWLYEQSPKSKFPGDAVSTRQPAPVMKVAASGVLFLPVTFDSTKVSITATPKNCVGSRNVIRTEHLARDDGKTALAVWVESSPPCRAARGGGDFEKDAFVLEAK